MRTAALLDLSGSAKSRAVTLVLARAYLALRALFGRPVQVLFLHAPGGDGAVARWPGRPRVHDVATVLDASTVADVDAWTLDATTAALAPALPSALVGGVDLRQLNRTALQDAIREYALLASGFAAVCRAEGCGRWIALSADPHLAGALARDLSRRAPGARRTWLCRSANAVRRTLAALGHSALARGAGAHPPTAEAKPPLTASVLLIEESRPMRGMFDAVEPVLAAAGVSTLRLRLARTASPEEGPNVLRWPAPVDRDAPCDPLPRLVVPPATLPALRDGSTLSPPWQAWLHALLDEAGGRQAAHVRRVHRLLDQVRPELVVVGNDRWWVGQAVVLVARQRGLRSVALQDGVMFALPRCYWQEADLGLLNGEQMREALLRHGVPSSRLRIVGQPRYDGFARGGDHQEPRARLRAEYGLSADAPIWLLATQPDQSPAFAEAVLQMLLECSEACILLRPHPSMDAGPLERLVTRYGGGRARLERGRPVDQLLPAVDLLVVQNSTLAVEAGLFGIPVMTCNLTGAPDLVPFGRLGVATAVHSLAELRRALAGPPPAPAPVAALEYLIGPLDGAAGQRAASELIGQLTARAGAEPGR